MPNSRMFVCVLEQGGGCCLCCVASAGPSQTAPFSYLGPRCDECAPGYYGNPWQARGQCLPCACNNNIDMTDPASCDRRTGQCLRCLHHTEGAQCQFCRGGYYGDATRRTCHRECSPGRGTCAMREAEFILIHMCLNIWYTSGGLGLWRQGFEVPPSNGTGKTIAVTLIALRGSL